MGICTDERIRFGPVQIGTNEELLVVPLLSWHHQSFDTEPAIDPTCWKIPSAERVVADFRRTKWPKPLNMMDDSVARMVDGLNDDILNMGEIEDALGRAKELLTFSHFVPRIELMPEKRYLNLPTLHSSIGSTFLEARLRHLTGLLGDNDVASGGALCIRHLHSFGHSHLSWDATIGDVRYINVPLAYPKEWKTRRRSLEIGSMH